MTAAPWGMTNSRRACLARLLPLLAPLAACGLAPVDRHADSAVASRTVVAGSAYATDAVARLYGTLRDQGVTGAPTAEQLALLRPSLTDPLVALLDSARRVREADARRTPGEKPAFAEGDLFSSLVEGPTAFTVVREDAADAARHVVVRFTDDRAKPAATWEDTVIVVRERGRWAVADVRYGGAWPFANRGRLLASLSAGLRDSAR